MELLVSILSWIFVKTIYGVIGIAAAVYVVLRVLRKAFPKLPKPEFIAVPVFLIGLFTVPSLPRYQFERDVIAKIEGKDWVRVVNKTRYSFLAEPLTWLKPPVFSIAILMPDSPIEVGTFRLVNIRYKERTRLMVIEPDCTDFTAFYFRPDKKGVLRYTSNAPQKMSNEEKRWYCQYDWSKEKEALRKEALRQMKEPPK
jgi:hypothetical protein